ncbi:hypothetical protein [Nocardiopsis sp. MG754419]|uniref:hypothetical protein n=1 Tax=Nocardiopsis sp. MG754419 TaxID=2259865 RepID=UPI001BABE787|nr:hypothetical protein [Nocardiopsis sp. MG754419]MBR8745182.1 hypothetical protein [Nocardiopsis sp. MG754419]
MGGQPRKATRYWPTAPDTAARAKRRTEDLDAEIVRMRAEVKEAENSQEAKRFDLLALRLQLGVLEPEPGFVKLRRQVQDIAEALLDPTTLNNPVVAKHRELLADLATDA